MREKRGRQAMSSGVPSTSAARGDDLKCRPFRGKHFSTPKNVNQHRKTSDDLFQSFTPKMKILRLLNYAPSAAPFRPVPPLPFSFFVRIYQKCHLFNVNLTIFDVNFNIFAKSPPGGGAPGATRPLCTPCSVRHWQ